MTSKLGIRESDVQPEIRLALSRAGCNMFRNNIGLAYMGLNRDMPVKFGLCVGSSDLIGYTPVVVTQEMVGRTMAIFTAVETKRPKGGHRSAEQEHFIMRVLESGGFAGFASSVSEAVALVTGVVAGVITKA